MKAYDIEILREAADRADPRTAGWCFGLPPGIEPDQWPLDPCDGYPLMHGFTVMIPDAYRCRGPDLVAISFFGTPEDMDVGEGGLFIQDDIAGLFESDCAKPKDEDLKPFWRAARHEHPRLQRFGGKGLAPYAAILLTQAEYEGALCPPLPLVPNAYRDTIPSPLWLSVGAAAAAVHIAGDARLLDVLGQQPEEGHHFNRALRLEPHLDDPNAGMAPRSRLANGQAGYQIGYDDSPGADHRLYVWADRLTWSHFGGTMRPGQNVPSFSPYYLEFEQNDGGFNFADGTAQLDLETMGFNIMVA